MEVLQSDALTQKSYRSHLLKARLMSLCAKYSMLPAKLHKFSITLGELKTQFNNLPVICCFSILVICIFQLDQHHSGDYVPTVYFSGKIKSKVLHLMNPGPKVQSWVKLHRDFLGFMISLLVDPKKDQDFPQKYEANHLTTSDSARTAGILENPFF